MLKKKIIVLLIIVFLNIGSVDAHSVVKNHFPSNDDVVESESLNGRISIHLEPGYSLTGYIKPAIVNPDGANVYRTYGVDDATKIGMLIKTTGLVADLYGDFSIPGRYKVILGRGSVSDDNGPTEDEYIFYFSVNGIELPPEYALFNDVPIGHWARDCIENLYRMNKISGYPDGSFRPENFVTRGELASLIYKVRPRKNYEGNILFDVAIGHWAYSAIHAGLDVIPMEDEYRFLPNNFATREDVVTAFIKMQENIFTEYNTGDACSKFSDYQQIDDEKYKYVNHAVNIGLISGYEDGTIRPKENITRAEIASIFYKFIYMFS